MLQLPGRLFRFSIIFLAFSAILGGIIARASIFDDFQYSLWMDRDLLRAATLGTEFQFLGVEMSSTQEARTPGGFLYYLFWLLLQFDPSPLTVYRATIVSDVLAMIVIWISAHRHLGFLGGIIAAALYITSIKLFLSLSVAWTPVHNLLPAALCWFALIEVIVARRTLWIVPFAAVVGIGMQIHFSMALFPVFLLSALLIWRIPVAKLHWMLGLAVFTATYLPFILAETAGLIDYFGATIATESEMKYSFSLSGVPTSAYNVLTIGLAYIDTYFGTFSNWQSVQLKYLAVNVLSALLLIAAGAGLVIHLVGKTITNRAVGRLILLLLVCFTLSVLIFGILTSPTSRRLIFLSGGGALIIAAGLVLTINYIVKLRSVTLSICLTLALLLGLSARLTYPLYSFAYHEIDPTTSYNTRSDLVDFAVNEIGLDHSSLTDHLGAARLDADGSWQPAPTMWLRGISYLLRNVEPNLIKQNYGACVLAVWSDFSSPVTDEDVRAFLGDRLGKLNFNFKDTTRDPQIFGYTTSTGNCYHSFANPYDRNGIENRMGNCEHAYLGTTLVSFKIGETWPLCAAIEISKPTHTDETTRATLGLILHSNLLRGHLGMAGNSGKFHVESPSLVIQRKIDGTSREIALFKGRLGPEFNQLSWKTPWRTTVAMPTSGRYRLFFTGRDVIGPKNDLKDFRVRIHADMECGHHRCTFTQPK